MQSISLVYPMAALVLLTFIVMILILIFRVHAVRSRQLSPRYFKLNKGGEEPAHLTAVTQNFNNLLELPILFYAVCILAIILNLDEVYFIIHAWLYVVLRYTHTLIHTTYNHILHRLSVFALSCIVLISMWINLVIFIS